ncbi:nickel-dependent hydrogenase large subunit [Candidatus Woesearchaeota archaeon]|nr:nickel-dependent hydrogenase large subunit [Candidatus Woesearchaeota archaeon]
MHQDFDITIENISKIEGHAGLDIKVKEGKVEYVKLKISENKRFYTQAIRGKPFQAAPQLMSRICGTCSIAHLLCCIDAIENTLGIEPSAQTILLRKLSMYGMMIRDHALHLYIFSLPDVFGKDSLLDFSETDEREHKLVHDAFAVKGAGSALSNLVAGRAVHAPYPTIGGFLHFPEKEETAKTIEKLKSVRQKVLDLIEVFRTAPFSLKKDSNFVALMTDDYSFMEGKLKTAEGELLEKKDYFSHLQRVVIPYSQASAYKLEGKQYMVGALARINLNREHLHPETKKSAAEALKLFPSTDVYHNNLAQAIELLHSIDHSIEILEKTEFKPEKPIPPPEIKEVRQNVGLLEAPRGGLFYHLNIGADGKIISADIMTPTSQNQIHMENSLRHLIENNLDKEKGWFQRELENLVRAYDPCMSCATHFLRINWK